MDELTPMQSFRAEREAEPPETREAIWRALEARIEAAAELAEPPAANRSGSDLARPGLLTRRRRLLAFVAAAVVAAIVAGTLVLRSGPTAQPASAAEILHEAAAAASDAPPTLIPGPGQFYFRKEQRLNITGWVSPVPSLQEGVPTETSGGTMHLPNSYNALVPTTVESWTATDGSGRERESLGTLEFWSEAEESRWKAAGSPLPPPFNLEYQHQYPAAFRNATQLSSSVVDYNLPGFGKSFHFPDAPKLPTEPKALRQAVEANAIEVSGFNLMYPKAQHLDTEQTMEELLNILFEGTPSPALQAAIFDSLAELPGIAVAPATDSLGRQGEAITVPGEEGAEREYIFDAANGNLLASRGVLVDPQASKSYTTLPAGTTIGERDFIADGVVDATDETPSEAG